MKTMEIKFDPQTGCESVPRVIDPELVLERALEGQFQWLELDWAGVVKVTFLVDDAVLLLAVDYGMLDEFLRTSKAHHIILGDGLLDVTAEMEGEMVNMSIVHCPHLDARFAQSTSKKVTRAAYQRAWWSLIHHLWTYLEFGDT